MADATYAPSDATSSHVSASAGSAGAGLASAGSGSAAAPPSSPPPAPVVVKKYANRRLYNTETSSYITLDNLADMIRAGRDFVVYDAKSGDDITRGVLTQIIVEEESKGTSMLPTAFLRQLIGFYGDSLQGVVPRYLETAMSSFAKQQQQLRQAVQQTISPFLPAGVEEMGRQNLAMIERAMSLFNPFHRGAEPPPAHSAQTAGNEPSVDVAELEQLRQEVGALRAQLAAAQAGTSGAAGSGADAAAAHASQPDAHEVVATPVSLHTEAAGPQHGADKPVAGSGRDAGMDVPPAGPIGAAAALAAGPHPSAVIEDAVHHAVDVVAGRAALIPAAASVLADPKAAALSVSRRGRGPRSKG